MRRRRRADREQVQRFTRGEGIPKTRDHGHGCGGENRQRRAPGSATLRCSPMGMERTVQVEGQGPDWSTIRSRIAASGFALQMRMIDNMPAFPDEEPEPNWQELR